MSVLYEDNGISLTTSNGVMTLLLDRGENRFNPALVSSLSSALTKVESAEHPKTLIVSGNGKFFSNGLDIEYMQSKGEEGSFPLIESTWRLLARLLVMDCRTVAAINGHAFGMGFFLALACDFRVMRTERGYLNFPELNLGMRLAKGYAELAKAKLDAPTLREGVLTGKRYASADAVKAGMVDEECPVGELQERAEALALAGLPENLELFRFDPDKFRQMKIELYTDAYRALMMATAADLPQSRL